MADVGGGTAVRLSTYVAANLNAMNILYCNTMIEL